MREESTHGRAADLFMRISEEKWHMLSVVSYEMATVLSRKYGPELTFELLDQIESMPFHMIDPMPFEDAIWHEFRMHKKKNISFVNCANLVAAKRYGLKIASFDAFYPKNLLAA